MSVHLHASFVCHFYADDTVLLLQTYTFKCSQVEFCEYFKLVVGKILETSKSKLNFESILLKKIHPFHPSQQLLQNT